MTILLGNTDIQATDSSGNAGYAIWLRLQASASGNINKIWFRVGGTVGTYLRLAIYSDNAGAPHTVLAQGAPTPVANTWISIDVDVAVTSGTYYWLAAVQDGSFRYTTGGTYAAKIWYDNAFTDDPSGLSPGDYKFSIYGDGTIGGWVNIAKLYGVSSADIAKWNGVAVADIAKMNGVAV